MNGQPTLARWVVPRMAVVDASPRHCCRLSVFARRTRVRGTAATGLADEFIRACDDAVDSHLRASNVTLASSSGRSACADEVDESLRQDHRSPIALWGQLSDASSVPISFEFDRSGLLMASTASVLSAFCFNDSSDLLALDEVRHPDISIRGFTQRLVTTVAMTAAGSASSIRVAACTRDRIALLDLEVVDEGYPVPEREITVDTSKFGAVSCATSVAVNTVAVATTSGYLLLWDVRTKETAVPLNRQPATMALGEHTAVQQTTTVCAIDERSIAAGHAHGTVSCYDLRASVPWSSVGLAPMVETATSGRLSGPRQMVACLQPSASLPPGEVFVSTLSGFIGSLCFEQRKFTGGTYNRDGSAASLIVPRFAASPTSSLLVCPRVDRQSLSLLQLTPQCAATLRFASPVVMAAVHPAGEVAGGVWAVDCRGAVWRVSPY
jgi:hypothetical protein